MNRRTLCFSFMIATGVFLTVCGGVTAADSPQMHSTALQLNDIDEDEIRIDISLADDESATWNMEFWIELSDDETREAFESLRDDIAADPEQFIENFETRIHTTVDTAQAATGRSMEAHSFDITTDQQTLAREYGVIRYTFEWDGFSERIDDELHAGDAIEGLFFGTDTRLLIEWPDEYELVSVSPDADDSRANAVIWIGGQTDFVSGEPRIVISPAESPSSSSYLIPGLAVGAIILIAGIIGIWIRRRSRDSQVKQPAPMTAGESSGAQMDNQPSAEESTTPPSESLLSNEEQVIQLIEDNGGRMKQKDVVTSLDWTDAKTSKVVSTLREEGEIESFRIGRENVLKIADDEDTDDQ